MRAEAAAVAVVLLGTKEERRAALRGSLAGKQTVFHALLLALHHSLTRAASHVPNLILAPTGSLQSCCYMIQRDVEAI